MSTNVMPKLKIGKIETELPIIQGGMGVGISLSSLSSAVANEGGIGVIAAAGIAMLDPDYAKDVRLANRRALSNEIRKAKFMTKGPIGVNILVALSDYDDLSMVCLEEGADALFLGAGLPLKIFPKLSRQEVRDANIAIVPIISSARAGKIIFDSWLKNYDRMPDGIVVEGPMAGGHLGFRKEQIYDQKFQIENLLPDILEFASQYSAKYKIDIPVIAAGGIYTGKDIFQFIKMGASGVQMATKFVATYECDASDAFKEAYVKATKEDICIIDSPVGLPGRALKNEFLHQVELGHKMPFSCPWKCLRACDYKNVPYCIALALVNTKRGNLNNGFAFAGENVWQIEKIVSVKDLMEELKREYLLASQNDSSPDDKSL